MKKLILVCAGLLTLNIGAILISSSTSATQNVITVKPAIPKYTCTKTFYREYDIQDDVEAYIRDNVKKGYVVKTVSMTEYKQRQIAIVVMEKY